MDASSSSQMNSFVLQDDASSGSALVSPSDSSTTGLLDNPGTDSDQTQKKRRNVGNVQSIKSLISSIRPEFGIMAASAAREHKVPFELLLPKEALFYFTLYAEETNTSIDALVTAYFVGLSGTIGRCCLVREIFAIGEPRLLPLNIFLIFMAATNNGKSSAISKLVRRYITKVQAIVDVFKQQGKGRRKRPNTAQHRGNKLVGDSSRKIYVNSGTSSAMLHSVDENGESVVINDEASSTMVAQLTQVTKGANYTKPVLMMAFTGEPFDISYSDMDICLEHPYVSYLASVQELGMLSLVLQFMMDADGFVDRFIHLSAQIPDVSDYLIKEDDHLAYETFKDEADGKPTFEAYFDELFGVIIDALRQHPDLTHYVDMDKKATEFLKSLQKFYVIGQRKMEDFVTAYRNSENPSVKKLNIPADLKYVNSKMAERVQKLAALTKIGKAAARAQGNAEAFLADGSWKIMTMADLLEAYEVIKVCDTQLYEYLNIANDLRQQDDNASTSKSSKSKKKPTATANQAASLSKLKDVKIFTEQERQWIASEATLSGSERAKWFLAQILKMQGAFISEVMIRKRFGNCPFYSTQLLLEAMNEAKLGFDELKYLALLHYSRTTRTEILYKLPPKFLAHYEGMLLEGYISIAEYVSAYEVTIGESCPIDGIMVDQTWKSWVTNRQKECPFSRLVCSEKVIDLRTTKLKFGEIIKGAVKTGGNAESSNSSIMTLSLDYSACSSSEVKDDTNTPVGSRITSACSSPGQMNSPFVKKPRQCQLLISPTNSSVFLNTIEDQSGSQNGSAVSELEEHSRPEMRKRLGIIALNSAGNANLVHVECFRMPSWKDPAKFGSVKQTSSKRSRSVSPPGLNQLKADIWRSLAHAKSQLRKTSKVTAKNKHAASAFIQTQSKDAGDVSDSSNELDTEDGSSSPNSSDIAFIKDTPSTSQSSHEAKKLKARKRKRRSSSSSSRKHSKRAKIKKEKEKPAVRRNVIQSDSGSSLSASPVKIANLDLPDDNVKSTTDAAEVLCVTDNQNVPFDGDISLIATKSLEDKRLVSDRILFGSGEDLANVSAPVASTLSDTSNRVSTVDNLKSSAFGSISVAYATSSEDEDALLAAADLADQHLKELESQKALDLTKNEPSAPKAIVSVSSASLSQEKPRTISSNIGKNTVQTSSVMKQATANRSAEYRSWTASRNNYGDAKFQNLIKPTLVFPKVASQRLPIRQATTNEVIRLSPQVLTSKGAQLIPSIKLSQGTSTSSLKSNEMTLLQETSAQADITASFQGKLPESQLYKTGDARVFDRKEDIRDKQRSSTLTLDHSKSLIDKEQRTPINQLEKLKSLPSDLSRDRGFSGRKKETGASMAAPIKDGKKMPLSHHKSLPRQKQTSADADYEPDSEMSDD